MKSIKKRSHRERILKQARHSVKNGRRVVPVPAGCKFPVLDNWPKLRLSEDELEHYFDEDTNIGWITGAPSGDLVDVDLDCRAAVLLAPKFLPKTQRRHGRESKSSSHHWFKVTPVPPPAKFTDVDGKCLVEIRSNGQQTLVPPSLHPNGERLEWDGIGEPARVSGDVLVRAVSKIAAGSLLARHWPKKGRRHDVANALAGMLLRGGRTEDDVAVFMEGVAEVANDEESRGRVRDVVSTAKKLADGGRTTGAPTLASIVGDEVVSRVRRFLGLGLTRQVAEVLPNSPDAWPNPASLGDELPPVQNFKLELLPACFRPIVEDISERMQTPLDYAAAAAVVALAGCVGRRAAMQPKAHDDSWSVVPNLWGLIVAPPGFMKTPVLSAVTSPLNHIQSLWRNQDANALAEFEEEKAEATLRKQVWQQQYKHAVKKASGAPPQPDDSLVRPVQRRLVTTDSTFEKLHELLSENPAGVLVIRDELSGWLAGLDREGREGERGFFLQAWSGDMSYTIDRIGRGSIHVPAVCISLLGNIQPTRLRWYLSDSLRGGANDDGLFQRFQVSVWPDPQPQWTRVDRSPNARAIASADQVYSTLANLPFDDPVHLRFATDAQEMFFSWWADLEKKVRGDSGMAPAMIGHLSKYRSLMPTLAALFEMADRVADDESLDGTDVTLNHAQQAVEFCSYLESHAHRLYSCLISPERRAAGELARHIRRGDLPEIFTTRGVYLNGWSALDTPERVRGALSVLEDAAWLRRGEFQQSPLGGRPSETWFVNPKVQKVHR